MQNNWGLLILLVAAVVIYALIKARRMEKDEDAEAPEGEQLETPGTSSEPETNERPWEVCQQLLSEEPPPDEGEPAEFHSPDQVETEGEPETCVELETEVEPVPESRHISNIAIRREAWRLFRENYWKILPLSGIVALLMAVNAFFPSNLGLASLILQGWNDIGLLPLLILPVTALGAAYASVRLWKGEAPRTGLLFHFYRGKRILPALGLMLLQAVIETIPFALLLGAYILFNLTLQRSGYRTMPLLYNLLYAFMFFFVALMVWLTGCFKLANVQMARAPERGAFFAFKMGIRVGSRHFERVMGMLVATSWPFGFVAIARMLASMWDRVYQTLWFSQAATTLNLTLMLFYGGYILLSMAGLAEKLLPDEGTQRELAENIPSVADRPDGGEAI